MLSSHPPGMLHRRDNVIALAYSYTDPTKIHDNAQPRATFSPRPRSLYGASTNQRVDFYPPLSHTNMIRYTLTLALCVAVFVGFIAPADAEPRRRGTTWSLSFLGGALTPMATMSDTHQQGLSAGARLGVTGKVGLGLDLAASYSPLPYSEAETTYRFETHFATAGLMPRYTLGRRRLRLWTAVGGGVAFERVQSFNDDVLIQTDDTYAPIASGSLGLELHILSGIGLTAIGTYHRTFGDIDYEIVDVGGGLIFSF